MSVEIEKTPYFESHRMLKGRPEWIPDVAGSQTEIGLRYAAKKMGENIKRFQEEYFERRPEKERDERVGRLFEDMNTAGYWHWLGQIDGYDANAHQMGDVYSKEKLKQNREIRGWAISTFTQEELRQILRFGLDMALQGVHSDKGQPGFKRGHTIMYSHLFEKPESMFSDLPTDALKKRLNNGRFWENLPELKFHRDPHLNEVEDILSNFKADLDPKFFEQGYVIFKRNGGEHSILTPEFTKLSQKELNTYWNFVKRLDAHVYEEKDKKERNRISQPRFGYESDRYQKPSDVDERIAYLIRPYLHDLHSQVRGVSFEDHVKAVQKKLKDPVLRKYLEKSEMLRKGFAKDMLRYAQKGEQDYYPEDKLDAGFVAQILPFVPKPREMMIKMIAETTKDRNDFRDYRPGQMQGLRKVFGLLNITLDNLLQLEDTKLQ